MSFFVASRQLLVVLALLTTACAGGAPAAAPPSYAETVGLAKCSVAASRSSPIITEWSAEQRAALGAARARGAIVVAFSGCEMRVLDGCHPSGAYAFERTTTSHERIDIRDEEELYAKMPTVAARLEAELERVGSISVTTTIVGQLRLQETAALPRDPACAGATHVVSAISVGAFETSFGAHTQGKASATIANQPVAVGGERRDDGRRTEGNAEACMQTARDAPRDDCNAPVQLFLDPFADTGRSARDERFARAPDSWSVSFRADAQSWTLFDKSDRPLCALPCKRTVTDNSGFYLRRDDGGDRVAVPDDLGVEPGSTVDARVLPRRGSQALAVGATMLTAAPLLVTSIVGIDCLAGGAKDPDGNTSPVCFSAGLPIVFAVSAVLAAGSLYWLFWSRGESKLDVERAPRAPAAAFGLAPGGFGGTF